MIACADGRPVRRDGRTVSLLEFGPYRLDPAKLVLWRGASLVPLPPKVIEVLAVLAQQAGEVVRKEDLLAKVWPDTFVEEANLSVNVSALRKALGRQDDGRDHVETVPRRGYRFLAPVTRVAAPPTVAVLPFRPLSAEADLEWLGAATADALVTRLSRTGRLVVRPTSAILKYGKAEPRQAARELGVELVVEGRLQAQGERLRATVQVLSAAGGSPVWAGQFEAERHDVFGLQDALGEAVTAALLPAQAGETPPARPRATESLAAYEAYSRGRLFWGRLTGAWLAKAFDAFQDAAGKDPRYAAPHAGLADVYLVLGLSGAMPPADAWTAAEAEARAALDLDDTLAEAHVSLAFVRLFRDWDWDEAGRALERAVAAAPQSAAPHQWQAVYLDALGRFDEAEQAIERARAADPVSTIAMALAGLQHTLRRRPHAMLAEYGRVLEQDPDQFVGHWGLGLGLLESGRPAEAVAVHRRAVSLAEGAPFMQAVLARTLVLAGEEAEGRALLHENEAMSAYQRATVELALGDLAAAQRSLEQAAAAREPWVVLAGVDPMLDPLRGRPEFEALRERIRRGAHS
jgi:DNA-binding winged helix-turn-helix (wHTH) protein/tetratricopeptide (TPR) repeat protein